MPNSEESPYFDLSIPDDADYWEWHGTVLLDMFLEMTELGGFTCPYCGYWYCSADFIEVDRGPWTESVQTGPFECPRCLAYELSPSEKQNQKRLTPEEQRTGWHEPAIVAEGSVTQDPKEMWRKNVQQRRPNDHRIPLCRMRRCA